MKKFFKLSLPLIILLLIFILLPGHDALAAGQNIAQKMIGFLQTSELPGGGQPEATAEKAVGLVIQAFLSIFGIIFFGLMLFGGFKWMKAQGREDEVEKAKDTIKAAIIGLAVTLAAYAITYFVISKLITATGFTGS